MIKKNKNIVMVNASVRTYSLIFFIFTTLTVGGTLAIFTLSLGSRSANRWWTTCEDKVFFSFLGTVTRLFLKLEEHTRLKNLDIKNCVKSESDILPYISFWFPDPSTTV